MRSEPTISLRPLLAATTDHAKLPSACDTVATLGQCAADAPERNWLGRRSHADARSDASRMRRQETKNTTGHAHGGYLLPGRLVQFIRRFEWSIEFKAVYF